MTATCEALAQHLDGIRETHPADGRWPYYIAMNDRLVGLAAEPLAFWRDEETDCQYNVVGESHYMPWLKKLQSLAEPGEQELRAFAILVRDFENQFDSNAVAVTVGGRRVGYIPSVDAATMVNLFTDLDTIGVTGIMVVAVIGWGRDRDRIGVRLDIAPSLSEPTTELGVRPAPEGIE